MSIEFGERMARLVLHHARIRHRRECRTACMRGEFSAREVIQDAALRERFGVSWLPEAQARAQYEMDAVTRGGFFLWTFGDETWVLPELEGFSAPWVLFGRSLAVPPRPASRVCVVGSRAASRKGMETARDCASRLARRGACIVSGGAVGIDAAAHAGALQVRGITWVFLGSGISNPYPQRNRNLFHVVAARGGTLFSAGLDQPPGRPYFVQRNAFMAACSHAVVVVEAHAGSGSLHTARFALSFGRPVFVFPGSPGCNRLLAEGARPVADAANLLQSIEASGNPEEPFRNPRPPERFQGELPEEIARRTGNDLTEVLQRLQIGELNGNAVRLPGGRWLLLHGRE